MEPYADVLADTPSKYKSAFTQIIPSSTFKNDSYNRGMSRVGGLLIFVSCRVPRLRICSSADG